MLFPSESQPVQRSQQFRLGSGAGLNPTLSQAPHRGYSHCCPETRRLGPREHTEASHLPPRTSRPSHPSFSPETEKGRKPKSPLASISRGARGGGWGDTGARGEKHTRRTTAPWERASGGSAACDDTGTPRAGCPGVTGIHCALCNFPFPFGCSRPAWRRSEPRLTCSFQRDTEPKETRSPACKATGNGLRAP